MTRIFTRGLLPLAALGAMLAASSASALADGPYSDCTCRYGGVDFKLGQVVCIRGQLAMCGMVANNTSWRFTGKACPYASLQTPAPGLAALNRETDDARRRLPYSPRTG